MKTNLKTNYSSKYSIINYIFLMKCTFNIIIGPVYSQVKLQINMRMKGVESHDRLKKVKFLLECLALFSICILRRMIDGILLAYIWEY